MARGRDQANPKSVMTGPAWQPARDKLRGAAHGTRKNAAKCSTTYHAALRADRKAFAELEFSGYQSMPGENDGDPDEWIECRQCDRCPSTLCVPCAPPKGNPREYGTKDPRDQFFELLRDPDPAAMLVAQDLALEHGLSIADLSESFSNRDYWPANVRSRGLFWLGPMRPADVPWTTVEWSVERSELRDRAMKSFTVRIEWRYQYVNQHADRGFIGPLIHGPYYRTIPEARRVIASEAWTVALALKPFVGRDVSDDTVKRAVERAFLSPPRHPRELFATARTPRKRGSR